MASTADLGSGAASLPNLASIAETGPHAAYLSSLAMGREGRSGRNPIVEENRRPGPMPWQLSKTRIDPASKFRSPWIEGYASRASLQVGETLELKVSTLVDTKVEISIYRMGFYGGLGGRIVHQFPAVPCRSQPVPEPGRIDAYNVDGRLPPALR